MSLLFCTWPRVGEVYLGGSGLWDKSGMVTYRKMCKRLPDQLTIEPSTLISTCGQCLFLMVTTGEKSPGPRSQVGTRTQVVLAGLLLTCCGWIWIQEREAVGSRSRRPLPGALSCQLPNLSPDLLASAYGGLLLREQGRAFPRRGFPSDTTVRGPKSFLIKPNDGYQGVDSITGLHPSPPVPSPP